MRSLGLYVPGDSFLHRAPAGAKLLVLLVFGVATVFLNQWPGVMRKLGREGVKNAGLRAKPGLPLRRLA